MEHYVVILDWASDYECGVEILGVTHTIEEAKVIFNNSVGDEKHHAKEFGYEIYTDCETDFDASEYGYYAKEHTRLYIQEV